MIDKDLLDLISTNQWSENNKYVESEAGAGGGKEDRDRRNLNDGGSDGDRDEQLDGDDGIDLADERPTELGALQHHRVERRLSRLQIMLLVPHPPNSFVNAGDKIFQLRAIPTITSTCK